MSRVTILAIDLVAICVLTFAIYFPRHRRPEMVLAYLGLNVGVVSVSLALSLNTNIGTGFGLGLFGALSIIRLRSAELGHDEVAYYFASLALGLLGGLQIDPPWVAIALPVAIVAIMFIGDHPRLFSSYRQQVVTLDRAIADEGELRQALATLLGAEICRFTVRELDLIDDSTVADVRYRLPR